jgi:hypothetical protein
MSDLTTRLRRYKRDRSGYAEYCHQAADEIDRLRVQCKMLQDDRAALREEVARLTKIIDDAWGEA